MAEGSRLESLPRGSRRARHMRACHFPGGRSDRLADDTAAPHDLASSECRKMPLLLCARGRGRTGMGFPPRDFKSLASTNFATRASARRRILQKRAPLTRLADTCRYGAKLMNLRDLRPRPATEASGRGARHTVQPVYTASFDRLCATF